MFLVSIELTLNLPNRTELGKPFIYLTLIEVTTRTRTIECGILQYEQDDDDVFNVNISIRLVNIKLQI